MTSSSALNLSQHQGLFNESSVWIRWSKYWSISFSISPSSEYSGLISLKIVWFGLLALQGTLRSLPQHHDLKASILWCSAFFTIQLSQPYVTTGKTTAFTIWIFVGRVESLLFNTLSRFVITFLQEAVVFWFHGCRHRLQWFWAQGEELCHCFHLFLFYLPWSDGADARVLDFLFSLKPALSLSSFTLIRRLFSSSSLSVIRVVSSAHLRLLMFLPPILIPACQSSSPAFLMMCSVYRLNIQGDSRQPWHPFLDFEPIICPIQGSNCCFLTQETS